MPPVGIKISKLSGLFSCNPPNEYFQKKLEMIPQKNCEIEPTQKNMLIKPEDKINTEDIIVELIKTRVNNHQVRSDFALETTKLLKLINTTKNKESQNAAGIFGDDSIFNFGTWKTLNFLYSSPDNVDRYISHSMFRLIESSYEITCSIEDVKQELEYYVEAMDLYICILAGYHSMKFSSDLHVSSSKYFLGEKAIFELFECQHNYLPGVPPLSPANHICSNFFCNTPPCNSYQRNFYCERGCGCGPHMYEFGQKYFSQTLCVFKTKTRKVAVCVCPRIGRIHICDERCSGSYSSRSDETATCIISSIDKGSCHLSIIPTTGKDTYENVLREKKNITSKDDISVNLVTVKNQKMDHISHMSRGARKRKLKNLKNVAIGANLKGNHVKNTIKLIINDLGTGKPTDIYRILQYDSYNITDDELICKVIDFFKPIPEDEIITSAIEWSNESINSAYKLYNPNLMFCSYIHLITSKNPFFFLACKVHKTPSQISRYNWSLLKKILISEMKRNLAEICKKITKDQRNVTQVKNIAEIIASLLFPPFNLFHTNSTKGNNRYQFKNRQKSELEFLVDTETFYEEILKKVFCV